MSSIIFILTAVICFAAVLIWDLVTDKKRYDPNSTTAFIPHKKEWWLRLLLLLPSIFLFTFATKFNFVTGVYAGFMVGFWFWFLFDGIYNVWVLKRGYFEIVGTSAGLDKLQQRIGKAGSLVLKLGGAALFTVLYLKAIF